MTELESTKPGEYDDWLRLIFTCCHPALLEVLPERLGGVLAVLCLLYNEGYSASSGAQLQRTDLAVEAIRPTRAVVQQLPSRSEAIGLRALMLLQHSRGDTRNDSDGDVVILENRDR